MNKCLLGWFSGKGVPKCPDDTEDGCTCVSKAVLAKCMGWLLEWCFSMELGFWSSRFKIEKRKIHFWHRKYCIFCAILLLPKEMKLGKLSFSAFWIGQMGTAQLFCCNLRVCIAKKWLHKAIVTPALPAQGAAESEGQRFLHFRCKLRTPTLAVT